MLRDLLDLPALTGISADVAALLLEHDDEDAVAAADPLAADGFMALLPAVNRAADVESLATFLRTVATRDGLLELSRVDMLACMRDVGFVLGSMARHGVEPCVTVPEIEAVLVGWGAACGLVPRDTVVHYGAWNPPGARERTYTGDAAESYLIDSVRQAADLIPCMAVCVDAARAHRWGSDDSVAALELAVGYFRSYVENFEVVRQHVSPAFFATELRPYYDPVTIDGLSYHGPAAAFLPMYLVDEMVWGDAGPEHRRMMDDAAIYGPPLWRALLTRLRSHPPLADDLVEAIDREPFDGTLEREGALVAEIMRDLVVFRGRHTTLARQAYDARLTNRHEGAGGFSPDALVEITRSTRDAEHRIERAVHEAAQR